MVFLIATNLAMTVSEQIAPLFELANSGSSWTIHLSFRKFLGDRQLLPRPFDLGLSGPELYKSISSMTVLHLLKLETILPEAWKRFGLL